MPKAAHKPGKQRSGNTFLVLRLVMSPFISLFLAFLTRIISIYLKDTHIIDAGLIGKDIIGFISFICYQTAWLLIEGIVYLKDSLSKIVEVTRAGHLLVKHPEFEARIVDFLEYYSTAKPIHPIFADALNDSFDALVSHAAEMAHGEIRHLPIAETNDVYMKELFRRANKKTIIRALSFNEQTEWWESPQGKEYYRYNVEATKRGAKIERIFVVKDSEELHKLEPLISQHHSDGIIVKCANACELPDGQLRQNLILFQRLSQLEKAAVWIERAPEKEVALWNLTVSEPRIRELAQVYNRVDGVAHKWEC